MQKLNFDKKSIVFFSIVTFIIIEVAVFIPWGIKKIISSNRKIKFTATRLKNIEKDWPKKDKYVQQKKQLSKSLDEIRSKFVSAQDQSKVFSFISTSSKEFGVEIRSLLPSKAQDYTSTKFGEFKYLPIVIKAESKFHNLALFLEHLRNSKYFFEIKKINISGASKQNIVEMVICAALQEKE